MGELIPGAAASRILQLCHSFIRRTSSRPLCNGLASTFHALAPVPHLLSGLSPGNSVGFLDLAYQWFSLAGYLLEILVGKLGPVLPGRTDKLFPFLFNAVPIHCFLRYLAAE